MAMAALRREGRRFATPLLSPRPISVFRPSLISEYGFTGSMSSSPISIYFSSHFYINWKFSPAFWKFFILSCFRFFVFSFLGEIMLYIEEKDIIFFFIYFLLIKRSMKWESVVWHFIKGCINLGTLKFLFLYTVL